MKYLYKYPQAAFPYDDLVRTNQQRSRNDFEYELLDTGIFDADRYFDVFVEYAKNSPEDILIQISVCNRGPEPATVHVLPTLWFRNTWIDAPGEPKPFLAEVAGENGGRHRRQSSEIGALPLLRGRHAVLFTENETNNERVFGTPNDSLYVKDGINSSSCRRTDPRGQPQ